MEVMGLGALACEVFSILASLASFALFVLYPLSTVLDAWKHRNVEYLNLYPFWACFLYNVIWMNYLQLLMPYEFYTTCLIVSIYIGYICEIICIHILIISTEESKQPVVLSPGLCIILLFCILYIFMKYVGERSFLGIIGIVGGVVLYSSPLSIIIKFWKLREPMPLPYPVCFACFLNGLTWFISAGLASTFDPYITITHGIGAFLGFIQLGVIYIYDMEFSQSSAIQSKAGERNKGRSKSKKED